jgi:hypothetical protein
MRRKSRPVHEASLGAVHGRAAHANAPGDLLVADPGIGSQQNLCSFELAGCKTRTEKRLNAQIA